LLPRDDPWLRELVQEVHAAEGRCVGEAGERIVDAVAKVARRHGAGRRLVEAVWTIERRRWALRVDSPVAPRRIRQVLFELAAERSHEEALATAAAMLGLDAAKIATHLFSDRARARLLVAPAAPATATTLADAYNLAVVQSLLGRATEVVAVVRANLRRVVGYAKLLGLMMTFHEAEDGATRVTLSGPMALFRDTVKYGNALARWFPSLVTTHGWSIHASVVLSDETRALELDASSPVPRTHAMPRMHDSRLEAFLEADLRRMASPWRIEREVAAVRIPPTNGGKPRLVFPDFALSTDAGRVLVEVVGYWTKDYLAKKYAMMHASRVPLVMCIDERHVDPAMVADPRAVLFKRRIDVAVLLRACERALGLTNT
jgi:predicted nuclease of restriction endonuclease-like RecB superfamily